mgnify:CR=1 FL=1
MDDQRNMRKKFIAYFSFYHSINLCNYFGGGLMGKSTCSEAVRKVRLEYLGIIGRTPGLHIIAPDTRTRHRAGYGNT